MERKLRNDTTNGSLRMAQNPPTPTSLPNTRFSVRFRNNLIVSDLSSEGLALHSKLRIPHDETCLTEPRNMPNLRTIAYLSSLERWPFATRKMPNGNGSSHTSHSRWTSEAPETTFSLLFVRLSMTRFCVILHDKRSILWMASERFWCPSAACGWRGAWWMALANQASRGGRKGGAGCLFGSKCEEKMNF